MKQTTIKIVATIEHDEELNPVEDVLLGRYVEDRINDVETLLLKSENFRVIDYHQQKILRSEEVKE